ncbi:hypothetical protein EV401DRAFT_2058440 [Pisolithus croceorrhizus]|nr:hypothetical protein EV401DRAFT_2058440 [Pisolithus croceorrhizus]
MVGLASIAKLLITTEGSRAAAGVPVSSMKTRDINFDQYTSSFHGRLLIEGAGMSPDYSRRHGPLGKAETPDISAVDFIVASARKKRIKEPSVADDVDDARFDQVFKEKGETDLDTFKTKAVTILHSFGFSQEMTGRPIKMSGGWRMRVLLAYQPPNHLNLGSAAWLEAYLPTYDHIIIMSNSQDFPDPLSKSIARAGSYAKLAKQGKSKKKDHGQEKISKHAALGLAKRLHHSADQLSCDKSPIEYFQSIFHERYSEEDVQQFGRLGLSGSRQTSPIKERLEGQRNRVVFAQLGREHPHFLLLDALALAIKEVERGAVIVSHNFRNCGLREEKDKTIKDFVRWRSLRKSVHH